MQQESIACKRTDNLKQFKGTRFVKTRKRSEMILQKCLQTCLKSIYSDCIPCYSCERIVRDSLPIKTIAMINSPLALLLSKYDFFLSIISLSSSTSIARVRINFKWLWFFCVVSWVSGRFLYIAKSTIVCNPIQIISIFRSGFPDLALNVFGYSQYFVSEAL